MSTTTPATESKKDKKTGPEVISISVLACQETISGPQKAKRNRFLSTTNPEQRALLTKFLGAPVFKLRNLETAAESVRSNSKGAVILDVDDSIKFNEALAKRQAELAMAA